MRRWALWWLVAALLAAPALGHMHRIVHGPQAHAHKQAQAEERAVDPSVHLHGTATLFAAHDDDTSCRLFDQLTHSDLLPALPALALPLLPVLFLLPRLERDAVARWAALFDARGPPALR
ncbi:hypothetical protein EZ313_05005 [Ramlibacter henchirensis]|uniref:DUF2946 domain-containing protein n=1 Tax=Ramlibacter henchirensis TaxID=204072 RepID=A0A4Z0C6B7_9BURK|nr:hypothetical protein [Ramlibacter henchirensis]TFZ06010.1 hypothetical protein EZ313_05005 [Ramlibacter henchirensis]